MYSKVVKSSNVQFPWFLLCSIFYHKSQMSKIYTYKYYIYINYRSANEKKIKANTAFLFPYKCFKILSTDQWLVHTRSHTPLPWGTPTQAHTGLSSSGTATLYPGLHPHLTLTPFAPMNLSTTWIFHTPPRILDHYVCKIHYQLLCQSWSEIKQHAVLTFHVLRVFLNGKSPDLSLLIISDSF